MRSRNDKGNSGERPPPLSRRSWGVHVFQTNVEGFTCVTINQLWETFSLTVIRGNFIYQGGSLNDLVLLFKVCANCFDRLICKNFVFDVLLFRTIGINDIIMWSDMPLRFDSNQNIDHLNIFGTLLAIYASIIMVRLGFS